VIIALLPGLWRGPAAASLRSAIGSVIVAIVLILWIAGV
jgi:hypothetical protein